MTITLQVVNELIASLESAGELSIKETKVMALAKAYQQLAAENVALVEALEKAQTINAAAEKLVRCKGRYHSEQNYRALAALFGVNTPDLPPLEHENVHYVDAAEMEIAALRQRIAELESRTVKLPKRFCPEEYEGSLLWSETEVWNQAISACNGALRTAGIKVEDE